VERLKKEGFAEVSEGALVVPLSTGPDDDTPPLILEKRGGGYLYHTSDLATVDYRVKHFNADLVLYVVDKRQQLHFKQVFAVAKKTGIAGQAELVHTWFGTMNGPDGKPFKTREGGVLKLRELIEMVTSQAEKRIREIAADRNYTTEEMAEIARKVGIATLKYADLKNNRTADYVFDLERMSNFEGNTGPYLLYAAVRIKSILRKAADQGFKPGSVVAPTVPSERALLLEASKLPDVVARAHQLWEPHHLADYGFGLSQAFNSFYKDCHILSEKDEARRSSWLALCKLVHDELVLCLELLGIQVPERM
jgi:arginyl-tRNA synthetase